MKLLRVLLPLVMIGLLLAADYSLVTSTIDEKKEYEEVINNARSYADKGITKYALSYYKQALSLGGSADLYVEIAEFYKSNNMNKEYISWCEDFWKEYPTEPKAYDCILEVYMQQKDYASCFKVLDSADRRKISTDYVKQTKDEIAYKYRLDSNNYSEVKMYSNNLCAVKEKDAWGFVDRYGNTSVSIRFKEVGTFTSSRVASVVNNDGEVYFIDTVGDKITTTNSDYRSFGLFSDNVIPAQKTNGTYTYVNSDYKELFGDYNFASTMYHNTAVVQKDAKWTIINSKGESTTGSAYSDIKLDESNTANRNDRLFVSDGNQYSMVDAAGNTIGSQKFEDARPFAEDSYAAVKIGGKWGFINKNGETVLEMKYEDARSFSNGLAAVKQNGKWGYIDTAGNMRIEPAFNDAREFNDLGSSFVMFGDKWQLLKLYRLNREE